MDPDSGSGSTKSLNPDPIRIRIYNPGTAFNAMKSTSQNQDKYNQLYGTGTTRVSNNKKTAK
jgi:hypothetical protein